MVPKSQWSRARHVRPKKPAVAQQPQSADLESALKTVKTGMKPVPKPKPSATAQADDSRAAALAKRRRPPRSARPASDTSGKGGAGAGQPPSASAPQAPTAPSLNQRWLVQHEVRLVREAGTPSSGRQRLLDQETKAQRLSPAPFQTFSSSGQKATSSDNDGPRFGNGSEFYRQFPTIGSARPRREEAPSDHPGAEFRNGSDLTNRFPAIASANRNVASSGSAGQSASYENGSDFYRRFPAIGTANLGQPPSPPSGPRDPSTPLEPGKDKDWLEG